MICLDVETTGVDEKEHSIIEIGAIDMENPANTFFINCQAKKGSNVSEIALQINGHTKEDIYDSSKPTQEQTIKAFDSWISTISEIIVIGENPRFDLNFINQMYKDAKMQSPFGYRSVDLYTTAINNLIRRGIKIPLKKDGKTSAVDSDFIMNYVGIPLEPKPHQGLNGAIWEAEAYSRLVYGKKFIGQFNQYKIPEYLQR